MSSGPNRRITALGLIAALSLTIGACTDRTSDTTPPTAASSENDSGGDGASTEAERGQSDFVDVVGRVRPSVVEISTGSGLGSGVAYDDKGNIVTNAHVVGNATDVQVTTVDGRTLRGTVVGAFPPDDLAVVRVSGSGAPPAGKFGDSSKVKVGQIVLAIGNPLGLESSVTEGIVSSTGRTVPAGDGVVLPSTIQTSAPINPGNSGGALVDLDSQVIGIPTLAAVNPELGAAPGIGFAVPSNTVKRIADQIIANGTVTDSGRAALGVTGTNVMTPVGDPIGVLVRGVQGQRAADQAGIRPGDIITAVDGKPTRTMEALQAVLADLAVGQRVNVDVIRSDGRKEAVQVTLGSL